MQRSYLGFKFLGATSPWYQSEYLQVHVNLIVELPGTPVLYSRVQHAMTSHVWVIFRRHSSSLQHRRISTLKKAECSPMVWSKCKVITLNYMRSIDPQTNCESHELSSLGETDTNLIPSGLSTQNPPVLQSSH